MTRTNPFRKSSYSGSEANCVETAASGDGVLVRDTKDEGRRNRAVLAFAPEAWSRFTASLKS
ncbi:MAG: DUF397 domain-containing protein [Nocardiopsaceae bacterium]|nr:DUF397 domain-containing protein [Nocardiopsaceae bacterium]